LPAEESREATDDPEVSMLNMTLRRRGALGPPPYAGEGEKRTARLSGGALIAAALVCGAATGGMVANALPPSLPPQQAGEGREGVDVAIENFAFAPNALTVAAGTAVVFDNRDDIPHTVVAVDKSFRSKALDTGDSFRITLTQPGEFEYFCGLHPHMTGKIVVTP
jgi:plastocyanin